MGNTKSTDNNGTVNNNVEVEVGNLNQRLILILIIAILILQVSDLLLRLYKSHRRNLRKRYLATSLNTIA